MIRDLEDWFAAARSAAEFLGCQVVVIDGALVMICEDA